MIRGPEYDYLLPEADCEIAYKILGRKPTLDPCGHPEQFLQADHVAYGTSTDDDGMLMSWKDQVVVLNPAHGERQPTEQQDFAWYPLSRWVMKASSEAHTGATVLALLPAYVDRVWFHQHVACLGAAASICFLEKRVKSYAPDRSGTNGGRPVLQPQPMHPHMWVLWTSDTAVFEGFYKVLGARNEKGKRLGFVTEPNPK